MCRCAYVHMYKINAYLDLCACAFLHMCMILTQGHNFYNQFTWACKTLVKEQANNKPCGQLISIGCIQLYIITSSLGSRPSVGSVIVMNDKQVVNNYMTSRLISPYIYTVYTILERKAESLNLFMLSSYVHICKCISACVCSGVRAVHNIITCSCTNNGL